MAGRVFDRNRTTVTYPDGIIKPARFIFYAGRAAVWVENKREGTAKRVLFATGVEFIQSKKASIPHRVITNDGEWTVKGGGGCGCGSRLKAVPVSQLVSDGFDSY